MFSVQYAILLASCVILRVSITNGDVPSIQQYHGIIREDAKEGTVVELDHPLMCRDRTGLTGDEICGYTLYKSHSELPFQVVLSNRTTGAAQVLLAPAAHLDYEHRHKYSFEVAAHDCTTGAHAPRETIHIQVGDVNDNAPTWGRGTYVVNVIEGRIYDSILQLEVDDADGTDGYSRICHFHILTPDAPFVIDSKGVLSNTEPLDHSRKHNYILEVKAEDCGGPMDSRLSDKLLISIRVVPDCKPGWRGFPERAEYAPGTTTVHGTLAGPDAHLELCDTCSATDVAAHMTLETSHIGKGCDRDTYSIHSQRKLCGASDNIIDLLPNPVVGAWTRDLPTDDGAESDQIFSFDGKTIAIEVPSSKLNHTLSPHFTISTWMKHEPEPDGLKEHIMCNADGEKMNRHHYSLFVHNCRLVLLVRQEAAGADLNVFKPAEWRFKLSEVCDGQWHHYAISVDFPAVRLYVDGKQRVEDKHNPDVIDDWPLHPSKKIHFTKLMIGACWQGGSKHPTQYFRGYLAGLSLLNTRTESDRVLQCLNNCKEKLDFHAMNEMETGMSVEFNSEMTEITINGHNASNVERLVRKIGYVNSRLYPTPGHRTVSLKTTVACAEGQSVVIPDVDTQVLVHAADQPVIRITGASGVERDEAEYPHGVKLFVGVRITAQSKQEAEEADDKVMKPFDTINEQDTKDKAADSSDEDYDFFTANRYKLDSCMINVSPPMNLDVEHLTYPENLVARLMVEAYQNENGLVFSGAEDIGNYEQIIRNVHYVNSAPADVKHRRFVLTCSELNGRFVSNEFAVQADVIHTSHDEAQLPQAHARDSKIYQPVKDYKQLTNQISPADKSDYMASSAHSGAGVGMIVIIVVCVGFLGFMIVLGVIRIRAAHHRSASGSGTSGAAGDVEDRQEMEWDNSALTITVNPMDQTEAHELHELRDDDSSDDDDDDDASSFHDDLESSEEEAEKIKGHELEWDDSLNI